MMKKQTSDVIPPISNSTGDNLSSLSQSMQALGIEEGRTLFNVIDSDVLGYICIFLTGLELCLLRRVCKASLTIVDQYMHRVFSVDRILSRFFTPEEIIELRRIQAETDFVISGSAAVQFFERISYPNSDLDLYIDEQQMEKLALFMEKSGYAFKKTPSQPDNILTVLQQRDTWVTISGEEQDEYGWDGQSIMTVLSFEKQLPTGHIRKVQAIVSTCEVIATVLAFHSTVVMNIITYQSAISFFPVSSFHRYHTIVTASNEKVEACLDKYRARGWKEIRPWPTSSIPLHQECMKGMARRTTDRWCWTIPLPPLKGCTVARNPGACWYISPLFKMHCGEREPPIFQEAAFRDYDYKYGNSNDYDNDDYPW
ncbi:hypothetical protein DL96DRAFT_1634551 [Flagelloscypha sp. PMI_526]|nr:hypothetical protein DL96DRAFT_1634551 [Flagelloscypha sp. PMI_526]